jgi:hypothetical protein
VWSLEYYKTFETFIHPCKIMTSQSYLYICVIYNVNDIFL